MQNCTCELTHFENAKIVAGALYTLAFVTAIIPLGLKHKWHHHSANFLLHSGVNDFFVLNNAEEENEHTNITANCPETTEN